MHGGVARDALGDENVAAVEAGCVNLTRHIENVQSFGLPVVVAVNRFSADTDAEMAAVRAAAEACGVKAIDADHWANGGAGAEDLAAEVARVADGGEADFRTLYPDAMPLWDKINTVASKLYRADEVIADQKTRNHIRDLQAAGFGDLPVCIAKTQYSFSTDPDLKGAPSGHVLPVREVRLSAGAGFVVVVCGDIMTMPGLPRTPSANHIRLNAAGQVEGLF